MVIFVMYFTWLTFNTQLIHYHQQQSLGNYWLGSILTAKSHLTLKLGQIYNSKWQNETTHNVFFLTILPKIEIVWFIYCDAVTPLFSTISKLKLQQDHPSVLITTLKSAKPNYINFTKTKTNSMLYVLSCGFNLSFVFLWMY